MINIPKKVLVIGGGTTGWWSAGYLKHSFPECDVTLIESSDIPTIGVGESTLPMIKTFFESIGMDESTWMPQCEAIHKFGNIKQGWDSIDGDEFAFTFWYNNNDFPQWYKEYQSGNKSKHDINDDLYNKSGWRAVAYHLNAEKAGEIVKQHFKEKINHVVGTLEKLPDGYDLYLDCTGFRRQFVKDKTEARISDKHLVNSAWVQPFELDEHIPYTKSIARSHGWQFKIGLQTRIGTGYVFSDKHVSNDQALADFKDFTKTLKPWMNRQPRLIKWHPNYLKNPWTENVVAIGMSQGFVDPLEANALFMVQHSITTLVNCLKRGYSQRAYNALINRSWKQCCDYILHHYALSNRDDSSFWKEYLELDVRKSLWENYKKTGHTYSNIFPSSIWATLALYYNQFDFYQEIVDA